jgi:hypothetical protein
MRSFCIGLVALGGALTAAPGAVAAPITVPLPTSVTVLRGQVDSGPFKLLVTVQRVAAGKVRIVVLRSDDVADPETYVLALARRGCGKGGRELARLRVRNAKLVAVSRTVPDAALRGVLSWRVAETCKVAGPPARAGAIVSPRDPQTGQATGLVAVQRRRQRVRVTTLTAGTAAHIPLTFGATTRSCDESFTATDDLWQFKALKSDGNEVAIETLALWDTSKTKSFAFVPTDGSKGPTTCAPWYVPDMDSDQSGL